MGPAGLLVPEGDADALRDALERVRDDARSASASATAGRERFRAGVRHPGLRRQDRNRTESSRPLGSLGSVSVLEKTAPEAASAEELVRDERITTIRPATRMPHLELRELWRFRELATDVRLARPQGALQADVHRRALGRAPAAADDRHLHAHLRPFRGLPVGRAAVSRSSCFAGVLPWTYFATSLSSASGSIAGNRSLVTRVYFPRLLLPLGVDRDAARRLPRGVPGARGDDLLVRHPVASRRCSFPLFLLLAAGHRARRRPPLHRGARPLSGRAVRDPVRDQHLDVPLARHLPGQRARGRATSGCSRSTR